jgi:hypothetical protein
MLHPTGDDSSTVEQLEARKRLKAEDARFKAAMSRALQSGAETMEGCVGRHEHLRDRRRALEAHNRHVREPEAPPLP